MEKMRSELMDRLGMRRPVIQAPMAGGATTIDLVAAVCEGGGLGFLAHAYSSPEDILRSGQELTARTDRPFGVNVFAPVESVPPPDDPRPALRLLLAFHSDLDLPPPEMPEDTGHDHADQVEAALRIGASVLSFTFGVISPDAIDQAHAGGMLVMGTATTVDEALILEAAGVDAVVAQGSEAGAHRGTFADEFESSMIGTVALVPQVVDAVGIPVVASGGIMDGRGIVAARALGAQAVQMGTAFLTCAEAGIPPIHKRAILDAAEHQTRVTRAFSGRPARGIVNRFMSEADDRPDAVLPYPYQNALTRPLRGAAAERGRAEFLSLWAGQGVRLARELTAAELLDRLEAEMATTLRILGS